MLGLKLALEIVDTIARRLFTRRKVSIKLKTARYGSTDIDNLATGCNIKCLCPDEICAACCMRVRRDSFYFRLLMAGGICSCVFATGYTKI